MFSVDIFPEIYLFADSDDTCVSLLRQVNDDQANGFVLGTPFFRNVTLEINYLSNSIAIWSKDVDSPIKEEAKWPDYDESK